jgi:hypothetical protein
MSLTIYLLKNVGIPEYYLGGNIEFLGDTWKHQDLGLAISARTYIQNVVIDSDIMKKCVW